MTWLIENWFIPVIGIILIAAAIVCIINFCKKPKAEIIEEIKQWLLQAVILAEKEYGSGTGKLKLSAVYAKFCLEVPWLAQLITFARFSKLVDDALVIMRELLEKNEAISEVVKN